MTQTQRFINKIKKYSISHKRFTQTKMKSISLMAMNESNHSPRQNSPTSNLPRFHKEFIGIGHLLQEKRKQRMKIEEEERSIANRVIFLQKQQLKAQKTLKKKKSQLNNVLHKIQRNNHQKEKKEQLKKLRQLQLHALRQENKHRRLMHKQATQASRFNLENEKHQTYSRIKSFIKEKQQQKKDNLFDDMQNKKSKWMSLNINKEKGKQKVDQFYKDKNKQHLLYYLDKIDKEQQKREKKLNTIKHLQVFENALRKKLQQSTMKVSQVQDKILQSSRTLQVKRTNSQNIEKDEAIKVMKNLNRKSGASLFSNTIDQSNPEFNKQGICQQRQNYLQGSQTERKNSENQNGEEIQEKIQDPNLYDLDLSGFKKIRTIKRTKRTNKDRYRLYEMY